MAKKVISLQRLLSMIELNEYEKVSVLDFNKDYYIVKVYEHNSNTPYEMLATKKRV